MGEARKSVSAFGGDHVRVCGSGRVGGLARLSARPRRRLSRKNLGRTSPASSTSTCWRCRGRRPFADAVGGPRAAEKQPECGERPYAFVVHGLWPQYEQGFPEFCKVPAPRLDRNIISSMLDLMPAPRLIFREWDRHGTCSGLPARAYFDTVRKARAVIEFPDRIYRAQDCAHGQAERGRAGVRQCQSGGLDGEQRSRWDAMPSGCARCASV